MFRKTVALWAVLCVLVVVFCAKSEPAAVPAESETPSDTSEEVEPVVSVEEAETLTTEEEETIRMEAVRIEDALIQQGYYRDDIPLTYLEQDYLHTSADEFGVDYHIMVALIEKETNFRNIYGDDGNAYGYCQIWPKYWSDLMEEIGAEDLTQPYDNFRTAAAILNYLTTEYGDIENALTFYNTGRTGKSKYADDVLANAEKWKEG